MKSITNIVPSILEAPPSLPRLRSPLFLLIAAILLPLFSSPSSAFAGNATWLASPPTGNWNHAANWTPATIPDAPANTATFATSNRTAISLSADTRVKGITFNAGASPFTITLAPPLNFGFLQLEFDGSGITNNSGVAQNFMTAANGSITFLGHATAGNGNFTNTNNGATVGGGQSGDTLFAEFSTAGNATFTNNGGVAFQSFQGLTEFSGNSTAGNATFTNNGSEVSDAPPGFTAFIQFSSADNATVINNGGTFTGARGGLTFFESGSSPYSPTAGNATLIANGGQNGGGGGAIWFFRNSNGGTARVELFGSGNLDIGEVSSKTVTVGSIEGDGNIFLGAVNLSVGGNNLSTQFFGVIQDGGIRRRAVGGSLTKTGKGVLVLHHRNTYTGGTTIEEGKLVVLNKSGSGTGSGPVQVNGGRLGGRGTIAGAVSVGNGSKRGAVLSPRFESGVNPGTLTIKSNLMFDSDGTYKVQLDSTTGEADMVIANGLTINGAAQFTFTDLGSATLSTGTVFTVIRNTAATPIAGTFSNLPDGSTFSSNGNTYQADYQGGDGNDLTLTVQ